MPSVSYNGTPIANSDKTVSVEGNHYFPRDSVTQGFLVPSETQYTCPWKGPATYWNGQVDGKVLNDVAWSYDATLPAAKHFEGFVAFDKRQVTLTA